MPREFPVTIYLMPWGRVGSNLVNSIVAQNRKVRVYNEPLTGIETSGRKLGLTNLEIWENQLLWLEANILNNSAKKPVFLNLAAVHILNPTIFAKLLSEINPVYLIQDREDLAATVLSAMRMQAWVQQGIEKGEKRSWAIPKGTAVQFTPMINAEDFLNMVSLIKKGRDIIKQITGDQNATTYFYEDLLMDMDGVINDIIAKAGLQYSPYEVKSSKFGSLAIVDLVKNALEVSQIIVEKKIATKLVLAHDYVNAE